MKNQNSAAVTSIGLVVEWMRGEPAPLGLVAFASDSTNRAGDLIPWCVLPQRARAQILDLIKYAGFDFRPVDPESEGQLPLPF